MKGAWLMNSSLLALCVYAFVVADALKVLANSSHSTTSWITPQVLEEAESILARDCGIQCVGVFDNIANFARSRVGTTVW